MNWFLVNKSLAPPISSAQQGSRSEIFSEGLGISVKLLLGVAVGVRGGAPYIFYKCAFRLQVNPFLVSKYTLS